MTSRNKETELDVKNCCLIEELSNQFTPENIFMQLYVW